MATKLAAIPMIIIIMGVALLGAKVAILLAHDFWIFHVPELDRYGFWSMQHESRTDFALLFRSLYLLIEGAGRWSIDALASVRPVLEPNLSEGLTPKVMPCRLQDEIS